VATVMQWGNSEGIQGRCDAKCHNATEPHCDCMCGGRYHGAGLQAGELERRVAEFGEEVVEAAQARARAEGLDLESFGFQFDLFRS
jgi:hypothetical protein